jgi:peptidoglycan/LPS O-acetylase OafA/YrhL
VSRGSLYKSELDGIRAICIVFTVAGHVPEAPLFINGTVGVDVFFALSGWLITSLLLKEMDANGRIDLPGYYIRRIFRIVPLYLLTITLYGAAAYLMLVVLGRDSEIREYVQNLPYLVTFNGEYMAHEDGLLFGHSWTLGIEEKFYLLWPLGLLLLPGQKFGQLVCATAVIVATLIFLGSSPELLIRGYAGLTAGAALAVLSAKSLSISEWLRTSRVRHGALGAMTAAYLFSLTSPGLIWNAAISFSAVFLVAHYWLGTNDGLLAGFLRQRIVAGAGRLTYAVYLTHVLVMNVVLIGMERVGWDVPWMATFLISYLLALALGLVLHHALEKPLITTGRRLSTHWSERGMSMAEI